MSTGYWQHIERLFTAALERTTEWRRTFVASADEDEEVRAQALSLLDGHEGSGRFDGLNQHLAGLRAAAALTPEALLEHLRSTLGKRYRIERELSRGGMAIVLLAEDLKHRRMVALKVLEPRLAASIGAARFHAEIAIAAQLAHPHILPLHDSGEADGLLYYVMPFVTGESLRDLLRRDGRLPLDQALRIARQTADALAHAHAHGVVHCDIKPANILLQAGHAVVSDFGIARAMSAVDDESDITGIVFGTPGYMSPEQAVSMQQVDARTDVYSLACVVCEMLGGRPPLDAAVTHDREHGPSEKVRLPPDVPAALAAVIERGLAHDPDDRYATADAFAQALLPHLRTPAGGRHSRTRPTALAAGIVLAVTGAISAVAIVAARPDARAATSVTAVLPFGSMSSDSELNRLGEDLALTLTATLDATSEIRAIDPLTVLAQTRQSGPLALEQAVKLGRLLGATSVVHGTIVHAAPHVRIDFGIFSTTDGRALAHASLAIDPLDLATLTDSLTRTLLRSLWGERAPTAPTVASITTSSLPALRAFLNGERAMLESRWNSAAEAYERAMTEDPHFWLAYWRYAFARWWYLEAVDDAIVDSVRAHRFALPHRDRLVFESWVTDTFDVALARAAEVVGLYPEFWPGWMQYADWLFHTGPVYGYELAEGVAALERTAALNPAFLPAWEHLFWATIADDTSSAGRVLAALERYGFGRATRTEIGFDITRVYRLELAWARSGTIDQPLLDSIASDLIGSARGRLGGGATLPQVQAELSRRVLGRQSTPQLTAIHEQLLAEAHAARGAWDSAVAVAGLQKHGPNGTEILNGYRLSVIGAWLGGIPPQRAMEQRAPAAATAALPGADPMASAELAWLDGLLALAQRDSSALAAARVRVRSTATRTAPLLARSLGALENKLAGRTRQAAQELAELNWERPDLLAPGYNAHPYIIAVSRLEAARSFAVLGEFAEAERLLMWFDAAWGLDGYRPARRVLTGLVTLERARIADRAGDAQRAGELYMAFMRRYDTPDDTHRHLVEEARSALNRLPARPLESGS